MSPLSILIIVLVLCILLGVLPIYPYSRSWGYMPGGAIAVVLVIIVILMITGRV